MTVIYDEWLTQVLVNGWMLIDVPDADDVLYEGYETDVHDEIALVGTIYFWTFLLEKNMTCQNRNEWEIRIYYDFLISIFSDHGHDNSACYSVFHCYDCSDCDETILMLMLMMMMMNWI